MEKLIRLSKSIIGEAKKKAVQAVLNHEYLGMGQEVQAFETDLTNFLGRTTVCVNTGTSALHLAVQALDFAPGSQVLVQSLTYVASFQAISAAGAKPIPCEIDPHTITIDLKDAEKRLTDKTVAIMPVHYASGMGKLDEIYAFAQSNGLRVIEDAAHAFGSLYNGKKVGSFGDVACFSFDGIKNITSGEGGAIVTDDEIILKRVRNARLLGVEKDTEARFKGNRSWEFDVSHQGWRYHMSNIMAAIGIEQLKRFPTFAVSRRELARQYQARLSNIDQIHLLDQDLDAIVPHIFVIKITTGTRDKVRKKMLEEGIQTGIHWQPNHFLFLSREKGHQAYICYWSMKLELSWTSLMTFFW